MNKERDFFKRCFNIVAKLDVQNENQLIAKEVVLDEVVNLQQENQQLNDRINKVVEFIEKCTEIDEVTNFRYIDLNGKDIDYLLEILKGNDYEKENKEIDT